MSEIPNIYVSKRCEHCIELIQILQKLDDIKGNFKIVSIDEEPFPKYIKAVPCMVLGKEIWNAEEIFRMLKESLDSQTQETSRENHTTPNTNEEECSSEKECSVDGYCSNGSCLMFSSLNGDDIEENGLDSSYSLFNNEGGDVQQNTINDNNQSRKSREMDSDYEKLLQERNQINPGVGQNGPGRI